MTDHVPASDPGQTGPIRAHGRMPAVPDGQGPVRVGSPDLRNVLLAIVAIILLVAALRATAVVMVPVVSSVLIALAVMPIRDGVKRLVPSWLGWLGHLLAMAVIVLVLVLFFGGIYVAARQLVGEVSDPAGQLAAMLGDQETPTEGEGGGDATLLDEARQGAEEAGEEEAAAAQAAGEGAGGAAEQEGGASGPLGGLLSGGNTGEVLRNLGERATGAAAGVATAILNGVLGLVSGLVIIFFLTLLILIESGEWRQKMGQITRPRTEWQLLESADVIAGKMRSYLLVQAGLGLATAALYAAWLWIFDVDLILVWSLLTLLLVFIPTVGSLVAGILPVAYTLLTKDFGTALAVGAGILVIEQVMGNFLEPRFQGRNIALSPLVILVTLLFWGWVWGLAGALLAVPVTVALVVLTSHVPLLRPWALLLSDRTDMEGLDEVTSPE